MLEVSNLTRYYGEFPALQDVSFSVEKGQIIGLLGLNGAGKSTTLKCLAGLMSPSSGVVKIDGVDLSEAPESLRSQIGYLPESPPLYLEMTVTGFLTHLGRLKGMSAAGVAKRLPEVLRATGLEGREHQVIGTLSHGFRKRVGIAQTVIHDPTLVILDEPISGLDPQQIVEMRKVIRGLGENRVVLISSHNLTEISQTCDRILVLQGGKMIAMGSEQDLNTRSEGSRIVIRVRAEWEALEAFLTGHEHVQDFSRSEAAAPCVAALVTLKGDLREQFIPTLVAKNLPIRAIEDPDDELEEIFLSLMEDGGDA